MLTADALRERWSELGPRLRERWSRLTDAELKPYEGRPEELVRHIQERTGEEPQVIEAYLEELTAPRAEAASFVAQASRMAQGATETVQQYAQRAAQQMRATAGDVAQQVGAATGAVTQQVRGGYDSAGQFVRDRPAETLVVAFGSGLIAGVVLGLVLRSKS